MKKILSFIIMFFVLITTTNAYGVNFVTSNTCNNQEQDYSYDYYFDDNNVKIYRFDSSARNNLKICFYNEDGEKKVLKNGEQKILKETKGNRENYEKIFCDNGVLKSVFKWTKTIKMACNFSVNNHKYVLRDGEKKIIKSTYNNTTISQKFECNNGKVKKVAEWTGEEENKKSCFFMYNDKVYKLDHNAYTTIKEYQNDHLVYKKFVCNDGEVKDYSLWRNTFNDNSGRELTNNCRFVYRGKYYDLQDNGLKTFTTTVYSNGVKKVFTRSYYCDNGVAKIH